MTLSIYFFVVFINLFLVIAKKKSFFLSFFSILVIFLLMAGSYNSLDNINYENHYLSSGYDTFSNQTFEPIFFLLMKFFNILGFSWLQFRFSYLMLLFPIFIYSIFTIGKNLHVVIIFYMTHLMFLDSEQLRNFGGLVFLFLGFSLYLKNEKTSQFIICIFLACLFHYSFIVYFLFIGFARKREVNRKFIYMVVFMSIILAVYTFINNGQIPFLDRFLQAESFDNERIGRMAEKRIGMSFIIPLFFLIFNTILANLESKVILSSQLYGDDKENENRFKLIYYSMLVLFSLIPLFFMSTAYYRLIRNMNLLIIVSFSYLINLGDGIKNKKLTIFLGILWQLSWIVFDILIRTNEILIPFFTHNMWY